MEQDKSDDALLAALRTACGWLQHAHEAATGAGADDGNAVVLSPADLQSAVGAAARLLTLLRLESHRTTTCSAEMAYGLSLTARSLSRRIDALASRNKKIHPQDGVSSTEETKKPLSLSWEELCELNASPDTISPKPTWILCHQKYQSNNASSSSSSSSSSSLLVGDPSKSNKNNESGTISATIPQNSSLLMPKNPESNASEISSTINKDRCGIRNDIGDTHAMTTQDPILTTNALSKENQPSLHAFSGHNRQQIMSPQPFNSRKMSTPNCSSSIQKKPALSSKFAMFVAPRQGASASTDDTIDEDDNWSNKNSRFQYHDREFENQEPEEQNGSKFTRDSDANLVDTTNRTSSSPFVSARQQLIAEEQKRNQRGIGSNSNLYLNARNKRPPASIERDAAASSEDSGVKYRPPSHLSKRTKFVSPLLENSAKSAASSKRNEMDEEEQMRNELKVYNMEPPNSNNRKGKLVGNKGTGKEEAPTGPVDERLRNLEQKMIDLIMNEIMDHGPKVTWDDIAGLAHAKKTIKEIIIWPMLRPDIFTGLCAPPKGVLLFGPPGTGKTLIGKCIASQSGATFFSISASSLTSKWVGEGEKMVRTLFAVARVHQPSVIFIDEIDSLLSQRTDNEVEASRKIKTEFLVQFDGCGAGSEGERLLVVGATNRPHEIDEAARRRLSKRLLIPLPDFEARASIVRNLCGKQRNQLSPEDINEIAKRSAGYSGSDMALLCGEAAMGPIRELIDIMDVKVEAVRPMSFKDFEHAFTQVRASVSSQDLKMYDDWNRDFGSLS